MTTHAVAVVNWQCASRVVCFDCRREWAYFAPSMQHVPQTGTAHGWQ